MYHRVALKAEGIEISTTPALQNGVDIKTLSGMLGHYSAEFAFDTYTHVTDKM